jgi:general secretion pathway protein G
MCGDRSLYPRRCPMAFARHGRPAPSRSGEGARQRVRGFTLIELVVTVVILSVLSLMALPLTELVVQRSREQDLRVDLRQIRSAIDAYKLAADQGRIEKKLDGSGYPASLDVLVAGVDDLTSPEPRKIYFMRRLPRDPFATDPNESAADTWGKRSYESPPDEPQEGDDVFDVYSLSTGKGMDGIPYKDW